MGKKWLYDGFRLVTAIRVHVLWIMYTSKIAVSIKYAKLVSTIFIESVQKISDVYFAIDLFTLTVKYYFE